MRIWLIVLVLMGYSCKTRQVPVNPYPQKISFGTGGGFTGGREEYIVNANGNVYALKSFSSDTVLIRQCSSEETKALFDQAAGIREDLNVPSNMYRFIRIEFSADSSRNLLWPIQGYIPPSSVSRLDSLLLRLQLP